MNQIRYSLQLIIPSYSIDSIAGVYCQPAIVIEQLFMDNRSSWIQRREYGNNYQTWISKDSSGNDIRLFSPIGVLKFLPLLVGGGYLTLGDPPYLITRPHPFRLAVGIVLDFICNVMLYEYEKQIVSIRYGWISYRRFLKLYR